MQSSNVAGGFWLPDDEILHVAFHGGKPQAGIAVYEYAGITYDVAMSFAGADSKGRWVWDNLRRNGVPYRISSMAAGTTGLPEWKWRLKSSREHAARKGWYKEVYAQEVDPFGEPVATAEVGSNAPRTRKVTAESVEETAGRNRAIAERRSALEQMAKREQQSRQPKKVSLLDRIGKLFGRR